MSYGDKLLKSRYIRVYKPSHPRAVKSSKHVYQHTLICERALGKYLPKNCEIHHVDGDITNNWPYNLVICQDRAYHMLLHSRQRIKNLGGNPNTEKICGRCQEIKSLDNFSPNRNHYSQKSNTCKNCCAQQARERRKNEPRT